MRKKGTNAKKYEAPVAVTFVVIGLLLAYLVTTFTYGQDPDDGVIDFSLPTRTALANAAATEAAGTQTNFGTKAAGIFSLFGSTPTLSRTATQTWTPTRTPVNTEQATRRKREDPFTATPRLANTKPPATATKKPNPTSTGTKVPTKTPPETTASPIPPAGEGLISGSYSLQGSSANLAGPAFTGGVTDQSGGACGSFLCRLIALIFHDPGGW